jgi:hypothetical protein
MNREMFIREIVKEARKPKRVPAKTGTFGDDLDGKMIYQHKTEDEIVEMFIDKKEDLKCSCDNEIKTGQTSVMCCNICGKPDEKFWTKGEIEDDEMKCLGH